MQSIYLSAKPKERAEIDILTLVAYTIPDDTHPSQLKTVDEKISLSYLVILVPSKAGNPLIGIQIAAFGFSGLFPGPICANGVAHRLSINGDTVSGSGRLHFPTEYYAMTGRAGLLALAAAQAFLRTIRDQGLGAGPKFIGVGMDVTERTIGTLKN